MPRRTASPTLAAAFADLRADYSAAKPSRFRRTRTVPLGGAHADYHYRSEADYLRMLEYARDFDRNDAIVGQTVDRAVDNTVQDGFTLLPDTGDTGLDRELADRWNSWAVDPEQCDLAGELTWWEMERGLLRACFVDGDAFVLPNADTGALELVESHRARTPSGTTKPIVHGVMLDQVTRRRKEYWFTREDVSPTTSLKTVAEIKRYAARDSAGNKQVFQVMVSRKRISQTRGVTAFAPIFDLIDKFEDISFAVLVAQQMVAAFAIIRERDLSFDSDADPAAGPRETQYDGSFAKILEGIGPGMEIKGLPGEKVHMDSPHVPSPEYVGHMRMVLQLIGVNLGMPLASLLLDASDSNFSGYRAAIEQARMGFRANQRSLGRRLHTPVYQWKLRSWAAQDAALQRRLDDQAIRLLAHRWRAPTWPYIQPLQDASADLLRTRNGLISRRRRAAERGMDSQDLDQEIVDDNGGLIERAHEKAEELNAKHPGLNVTWREVACLPTPDGVQVAVQPAGQDDTQNQNQGAAP